MLESHLGRTGGQELMKVCSFNSGYMPWRDRYRVLGRRRGERFVPGGGGEM